MHRLFSLLLTGTFLFLFSPPLLADKFHGELCWQVFSSKQENLWRYRFGVYEKEGGHFVLLGSIDYGPNGPSASHGNAIVIGNSIKMTIVSTDYEDGNQVWSETVAVKLDSATLNGTWNALSLESDDGETEVLGFRSRGTINLVTC
ncbi:MAG: hypothetical protein IT525_04885 [Nitrosomonas sp.]|nr:hypothetical protein [Nitrosomonas sp.]